MPAILYILSITIANVITARFEPFHVAGLIIPAGSLIVGATFMLRDWTQEIFGRKQTYGFIAAALVMSAVFSISSNDPLAITLGSALAFIVSEATDTEIFTRMRASFKARVFWSGVVGGLLDSGVFVVVALSPIGAGFIPWSAVPAAIAGQVICKVGAQFLVFGLLKKENKRGPLADAYAYKSLHYQLAYIAFNDLSFNLEQNPNHVTSLARELDVSEGELLEALEELYTNNADPDNPDNE